MALDGAPYSGDNTEPKLMVKDYSSHVEVTFVIQEIRNNKPHLNIYAKMSMAIEHIPHIGEEICVIESCDGATYKVTRISRTYTSQAVFISVYLERIY